MGDKKEQQITRIYELYDSGIHNAISIKSILRTEGLPISLVKRTMNNIHERNKRKRESDKGWGGKYLHKKHKETRRKIINNKCPVCLIKPAISKHHIIPLMRGGTDKKRNTVMVCKHCHDILEEYANKELYYTPSLAKQIRLSII